MTTPTVEKLMIDPRCDTCRFWVDKRDKWAGMGECRRFPPSASRDDRRNGENTWPQTTNRSWCGEYAEKTSQ